MFDRYISRRSVETSNLFFPDRKLVQVDLVLVSVSRYLHTPCSSTYRSLLPAVKYDVKKNIQTTTFTVIKLSVAQFKKP